MSLKDTYKEKFNESLNITRETGFVEEVTHPIAYVNGLPKAKLSEVVFFESGCMGVVTSLLEKYVEVMVFKSTAVLVGEKVSRSDEILHVPVGDGLLGNVVDSLGKSLYENRVITGLSSIEILMPLLLLLILEKELLFHLKQEYH